MTDWMKQICNNHHHHHLLLFTPFLPPQSAFQTHWPPLSLPHTFNPFQKSPIYYSLPNPLNHQQPNSAVRNRIALNQPKSQPSAAPISNELKPPMPHQHGVTGDKRRSFSVGAKTITLVFYGGC